MSKKWLIDAYNLMHKIPRISRKLQTNVDEARFLMAEKISRLCVEQKKSAALIFDGAPGNTQIKVKRVSIFYSFSKKADDLIIARLNKKEASKHWILVTDDQELIQHAHRNGVKILKASAFIKTTKRKSIKKSDNKGTQNYSVHSDVIVSQKEVDEMLLFYKLKREHDKD